jgi:ribokinase
MTDVLTCGAINTDLVARLQRAPEAGETVTGTDFAIFGGGKGANQALASVRAGASTAILGALGEDDFGRQRLGDLRADQVDVGSVAMRTDAPSGVALITVEEQTGQNRIAYVPGATLTVTADEARAAVASVQPRVLLTTLELPAESIAAAIADARTAGATILLNATPEPELAAQHLGTIDTLIVNEPEAQILLGGTVPGSWTDAAKALQALGPRNLVITLGAAGAIARFGDTEMSVPVPSVTVVDTTGAGDALCGAFAAATALGKSPEDALRFGVAAGSLACTVLGAQRSMPTAAAINALLG